MRTIVRMSSQARTTIDNLLGSSTRARLLRVLLLRPYPFAWVRDLCRRVDVSPGTLRRDLDFLTSIGLAHMQRRGGATFIQAVEEHPFYEPLRQLIAFADDYDRHGRTWRNIWPWIPSGAAGTGITLNRLILPNRGGLRGHMDARTAYDAVSAIIDPVFLVGGSVRDALMGRESHDHDFATPMDADTVEQRVRAVGRRPYLLGKKYGTIGFRVEHEIVEVTSFRTATYRASRRPHVEFLPDLEDDLAHRDFTINAMAMHDGELVDPFGGRADLANRTVRAVGVPRERFAEDPLRMLRAARFVAELDFRLDPVTYEAIAEHPATILDVARERWMLELDRLLIGPAAETGLRVLAESGLLRLMLPELALQQTLPDPATASDSLFDATLTRVDTAPAEPVMRWAALLADVGRPFARGVDATEESRAIGAEIVVRTALYLKWSNERRAEVTRLVLQGSGAGRH